MRSTIACEILTVIAAVLVTSYLAPRANAFGIGPIPLDCDRACLEDVVDQYLAAVVVHDPSPVPFSEDVMYTENNQVMEIGDGFWKTAEDRGRYTHIFADPEAGQVAFMGTMIEAGGPILLSLRLRIQLGRITEVESVFFKPGGGGPNNIASMDAPHVPEPFWFKSIPAENQTSRQELIAVADAYFTGLEKNDGRGVNGTGTYPFTDDCNRLENGSQTTNVALAAGQDPNALNVFSMSCQEAFSLGMYYVVQNIHQRRYTVVDRERGVVYAHSVLDQGTVNSGTLSDGRPHSYAGFNRPSSILVTEAFLIEDGKIRSIEMVGPSAPYHINSPWGGLSGN